MPKYLQTGKLAALSVSKKDVEGEEGIRICIGEAINEIWEGLADGVICSWWESLSQLSLGPDFVDRGCRMKGKYMLCPVLVMKQQRAPGNNEQLLV